MRLHSRHLRKNVTTNNVGPTFKRGWLKRKCHRSDLQAGRAGDPVAHPGCAARALRGTCRKRGNDPWKKIPAPELRCNFARQVPNSADLPGPPYTWRARRSHRCPPRTRTFIAASSPEASTPQKRPMLGNVPIFGKRRGFTKTCGLPIIRAPVLHEGANGKHAWKVLDGSTITRNTMAYRLDC